MHSMKSRLRPSGTLLSNTLGGSYGFSSIPPFYRAKRGIGKGIRSAAPAEQLAGSFPSSR
jgi:hypothetical protein